MEILVKAAWAILALVHVAPATALFSPGMLGRLYGIAPGDDLGLLMTHRAALFLAVFTLCLFSVVDPAVRRAATVAIALSLLAFLFLYVRAGLPHGALRTVALVDVGALVPLLIVSVAAWRSPAGPWIAGNAG